MTLRLAAKSLTHTKGFFLKMGYESIRAAPPRYLPEPEIAICAQNDKLEEVSCDTV
jgi:hypothetical protein